MYDVLLLMAQCSQVVLKHVEETKRLSVSECERVQSVELVTSPAHETVFTVQSHTAIDPRYVQLLGDKAAVCLSIFVFSAVTVSKLKPSFFAEMTQIKTMVFDRQCDTVCMLNG